MITHRVDIQTNSGASLVIRNEPTKHFVSVIPTCHHTGVSVKLRSHAGTHGLSKRQEQLLQ